MSLKADLNFVISKHTEKLTALKFNREQCSDRGELSEGEMASYDE